METDYVVAILRALADESCALSVPLTSVRARNCQLDGEDLLRVDVEAQSAGRLYGASTCLGMLELRKSVVGTDILRTRMRLLILELQKQLQADE